VLSGLGASARWRIERAPTVAFRSGDIVALRSKSAEKFLGLSPPSVFEDDSTTPVPSDTAYHFHLLGPSPLQYGGTVFLGNAGPGGGWLARNGSSVNYLQDFTLVQTRWVVEPTCSNCSHVFPEATVRLVADNGKRLKDKGPDGLEVLSGTGGSSEWIIMDATP
jgi:hypothetical protein